MAPDEVRWEALEALPARGDWPQGATSDDTAQLLLVAEYVVDANGQQTGRSMSETFLVGWPGHCPGCGAPALSTAKLWSPVVAMRKSPPLWVA
jgi:hypothetical protein